MQDPDIRFEVKFFKIDFQSTRDQIMVIADYKALHNQLHELEIRCYNGILTGFKCFPDDISLDILSQCEQDLEDILGEVESIVRRKTFQDSTMIMRDWIKDISNSKSQLDKALVDKEKECLKKATKLLHRVLSNFPSNINDNLHRVACDLKLERLINPMQSISESLTKNEYQEKLSQFSQGVNALKELNKRLFALVKVHDFWQGIDRQLRRIEDNWNEDNLMELDTSWPDLKEVTKILFTPPRDEWTELFEQASNNLDTALTNDNFPDSQKYFRAYRLLAAKRFYKVDAQLQSLCQELREVGEPLVSILRIIEE
jgi:gas vesicle protein